MRLPRLVVPVHHGRHRLSCPDVVRSDSNHPAGSMAPAGCCRTSSGREAGSRREIDLRPGDVVEVVGEDVQRDVGHDLANLPIVAGPAELFHIGIGHDATVLNDLASEDQRGLLLLVIRRGTPGLLHVLFGEAGSLPRRRVCRQAIAAGVGFADDQGDLLPNSSAHFSCEASKNVPRLGVHWYLHNSQFFVTYSVARDWAAFNGGGSLVNFSVTMNRPQCEGPPHNEGSGEISTRAEGVVAHGVILLLHVDLENRIPRGLTLT